MSGSKTGGQGSSKTGSQDGGYSNKYYGTDGVDTISFSSFIKYFNSDFIKVDGGWDINYTYSGTMGTGKVGDEFRQVNRREKIFVGENVERIHFSDADIALDLGSTSKAAGAALALYYAGFNSAPDKDTMGRWISEGDKSNQSKTGGGVITDLAFKMWAYYVPNGVDNLTLSKHLYKNVYGSESGYQVLLNKLNSGAIGQVDALVELAQTTENLSHYDHYFLTGIQYNPNPSKI